MNDQIVKYDWKSDKTYMLRQLHASRAVKEKNGWTRESGSGFIKEDIQSIKSIGKKLLFEFSWGNQLIEIKELNLRETEEAIEFLELVKQ